MPFWYFFIVTIHSLYIENIAKTKDLGYNKNGDNMKKNAFTLVELIAVITIIAVILLVSLPSLLGTIQNTNDKRYQDFLDNLYMITENYIDLQDPGDQITITIYDLKQADYIRTNPTNPKTDAPVSDLDTITITRTVDKTYSYEFSIKG